MSIKEAYYYLFYKLYKFWEIASTPKFWSDAKAILSIVVLELFIIQSLIIYYRVFINKNSHFGEGLGEIIVMLFGIFIPNYLIFLHKDQWKQMVLEFEKWPHKRNQVGGIVIWSIISIIIVHFFLVMAFL